MLKPNIFDYATSELSQDAIITYLLNCAKCKDIELAKVGKSFVLFLLNMQFNCSASSEETDIQLKTIIQQSLYKIDVFFVASINGVTYSFIIEDKVYSKAHSNQLTRYAENVEKHKVYGKYQQVKIYFKTGYLFESEIKVCEKAGFSVLNLESLCVFFGSLKTNDQILNSYKQYILQLNANRNDALKCYDFSKGFVQYEFLKELRKSCNLIENKYFLSNGSSFGKAYSQLRLITHEGLYNGVNEHLFFRIETMKKGRNSHVTFSLRHYANLKSSSEKEKPLKIQRFNKLVAICSKILESIPSNLFTLKTEIKGNKVPNSSTVFITHIDVNNKSEIQNWLKEFTPKFLAAVNQNSIKV